LIFLWFHSPSPPHIFVLSLVNNQKNKIMKNLINISTILFAIITLSFFSSCTPDTITEVEKEIGTIDQPTELVDFHHIHDEVCNHVKHLDMDLENPEVINFEFPDGTSEERFLIEDDIVMTRAELNQLKEDMNGDLRQYRTYNLVNSPRIIKVIGYTGNGYELTGKMKTGLQWAISNYNWLNTGLTFQLTFEASTNADIVVYKVSNGKAGGSAGFPSNGNPYKWVQIFDGLDSYSNNVNEHVIGHEIGHCLGLRHSDFNTRASCNRGTVNEGAGSEGAVHIPGTAGAGQDLNSLMQACFDGTEDGEFSYYDRVALEYLY